MSTPPTAFLAEWTRLWEVAQRVAVATEGEPGYAFEPVGLLLEDPARARAWEYDATPVNVTTFASTGGDGVHFSVVDVADHDGATPVVMTVPMAFDNPNHILAESLGEFLALGSRAGYFCLERLAYGWGRQETITRLQAGRPPDDAGEALLLRHLAEEFDIRPWRTVERRLGELDATHRAHVQMRHDA
ncbi:hypothetical protein [Micromonospora auratinigra]|uniref:Uncharacterized protein n=1 Tax=Micromonospora auratinigra TaxID=261654 RepID=A0A1A8ZAL8_9ACTN|nr:hypothetical protein [Micromonospora auratinigra]SBT40876.1 hypothetical protein GA0070611_1421 [Micromonospora auratinigra]